jgi:prepilin-type processing-associated H-X9-DG protein
MTWYFPLLAFVEQTPVYNATNFRLTISTRENQTVRMAYVNVFGCPSDGLQEDEFQVSRAAYFARVRGNYAVNFGNADFGQDITQVDPYNTSVIVPFLGVSFGPGKSRNIATITDGTSQTLMWAEVITPPDSPNNWDGPIADSMVAVGGCSFEGLLTPNATLPDHVNRMCPTVPGPGVRCFMFNANVGVESLQYFAARSLHPGGINASFCDGSVRFFKDSINRATWRAHELAGR